MKTFEDTEAAGQPESLPLTYVPATWWQRLRELCRLQRPMIADVRAEELYQAQLDLINAEHEAEQALCALRIAQCRVKGFAERISRLSNGSLPRGNDGNARYLYRQV